MKKLAHQAERAFSVEKDGFFGEFYRGIGEGFPGKSMILFGGSAGKFLLTQMLAQWFVEAGLSVVALAYHGEPGLPQELRNQPVDVVERAAQWLHAQGFEKVGLWGISMGGGLALLAGSLLPELVSCVVAAAPLEMVTQAQTTTDHLLEGSSFSFHGQPLPYVPFVPSDGKAWHKAYMRASWQHKEPYTRELLLDAYRANPEPRAVIATWNIAGPVLLLGGEMDGMCPNRETFAAIGERMRAHGFPHAFETRFYPHLGHYVLPLKPYTSKMLRAERKFPAECDAERQQSWQDTLQFLREKW